MKTDVVKYAVDCQNSIHILKLIRRVLHCNAFEFPFYFFDMYVKLSIFNKNHERIL